MNRKSKLSAEERDLFRRTVGEVKPLSKNLAHTGQRRPLPLPQQTRRDNAEVLKEMMNQPLAEAELETGEELVYKRPGVQDALLKKLRRGHFSVHDELDLHGLTVSEAHVAVGEFLGLCQLKNARCLRIIHGKGKNSHRGLPVLKHKLNKWLQQNNEVLAFCSARPNDGGTGAVYVLLRQRA